MNKITAEATTTTSIIKITKIIADWPDFWLALDKTWGKFSLFCACADTATAPCEPVAGTCVVNGTIGAKALCEPVARAIGSWLIAGAGAARAVS